MPYAQDNVQNSFFPHSAGKSIDTLNRERTVQTLDKSTRGDGRPSPPYGTFMDLAQTKYGINRFFKTAGEAMLPLFPRMTRTAITNPNTMLAMPGYTGNLNVVQTQLGRMIQKDYTGQY